MKDSGLPLSPEEANPPRMTEQQMAEFEACVAASRDANEFAKKAIIWLLRQSKGLTRAVCLCCPASFGKDGLAMQNAAHDMNSVSRRTRIDLLFHRMGTPFGLSHHNGIYGPDGRFGRVYGHTIWISPYWYDHDAERFTADCVAIDAVSLEELARSGAP